MGMIDPKSTEKLNEVLAELTRQVRLVIFTKEHDCQYCPQTKELMEELAGLSEHLTVEGHDLEKEPDVAKQFGVDKAPGIVIMADQDVGIRFYGIPAGYEFTTLVEAILDVGRQRPSPLAEETQTALAAVAKPVHIQVFVTPT
jgi:alkyl hydroperoxide reductase subunit AhpF